MDNKQFWTSRTIIYVRAMVKHATDVGHFSVRDVKDECLTYFPSLSSSQLYADIYMFCKHNLVLVKKGKRGSIPSIYSIPHDVFDEYMVVDQIYADSYQLSPNARVTPHVLTGLGIALSVCDSHHVFDTSSFAHRLSIFDTAYPLEASTLCNLLLNSYYTTYLTQYKADYPKRVVRKFLINPDAIVTYQNVASASFQASFKP